MAGITWQLDPTSEDATNTPLDIADGTTYVLLEENLPDPELDAQYASSIDTDGDPLAGALRYRNTRENLKIRVYATTYQNLQTAIYALQRKAGKVNREGGTAKRALPSGTAYVKDIISMRVAPDNSKGALVHFRDTVNITFESKPGWRATTEIPLTAHNETSLPCLTFTETGIKGDLPARGRLVITDAQGADQRWVIWGLQSHHYNSSADASLFYEAEGRTAMGGSSVAAGPSGASGAGSNVMRNSTLASSLVALLSTQATGGGAHLSHVGDYRVLARVQTPTTNTGQVSVGLEWAQGDFLNWTRNDLVTLPIGTWDGTWRLLDLGQVHLSKAQGTQRWEGRVVAKSTVPGDDIDIDHLILVPFTEGSGEARAVARLPSPTSFVARDEFDQTAGNLTGKTATVGGTWTYQNGDSDDYTVNATSHRAQRSTSADSLPRIVSAGTTNYAAVMVCCDISYSGAAGYQPGVVARYDSATSSWVRGYIDFASNAVAVDVVVNGSNPTVWSAPITPSTNGFPAGLAQNVWYTLSLQVDVLGYVTAWLAPKGADPYRGAVVSVPSPAGIVATGKVGLGDYSIGSGTALYDSFTVRALPADAAIFASQSLEVRHNQVLRENAAGTVLQAPSAYAGNYLMLPPAGPEGRTLRVLVKATRSAPDSGPDGAIDDISAQLFYTPRYLCLPE